MFIKNEKEQKWKEKITDEVSIKERLENPNKERDIWDGTSHDMLRTLRVVFICRYKFL